jgi:hypothetical protein
VDGSLIYVESGRQYVAYAGGLGPVLGQGVVGEFLDRSGDVFSKWLYKNGRAWSGFNEDMPIGGASSLASQS